MSDFVFTMQRLLDVRLAEEEARRRRLAGALQAKAAQERKLEGLVAEEIRVGHVRQAILERSGPTSEVLYAERSREAIRRRIKAESEILAGLLRDVEGRRREVEAARLEVAKFQRLKERQYEAWRQACEREERWSAASPSREEVA